MKREEFLAKFKDILQTEEDIDFKTPLKEIEEWDSLSKLSLAVFLDQNFSIRMTLPEFDNMKTVEDLALKAGL